MRLLLTLLLLLTGTTGCDPCRDLDPRFARTDVRTIPSDAPVQLEVQVSLPALSVRLGEAFTPGSSGPVRWTGLSLERTSGLAAAVSIVVDEGGVERAGSVVIPVAPKAQPKGPGVAVFLEPTGPAEVRFDGLADAARARLDALAQRPEAWLTAPALDVLGWFREDAFLPLQALSVSAGKGVLILQLATGLQAPPLTVEDSQRRPGMADDVTISMGLGLLTALHAGGWLPLPPRGPSGATEATPTWPTPPDGWQVRAGVPAPGERDLRVPWIARRTDTCSFVAVDAEVKPGIALGHLGWHPPQKLTVTERRGDSESLPDHVVDDLTRAALASLAAPLSPPPVLGPATVHGVRGPLRLVRLEGDAVMLDGLLVPAKARPKRGTPPRGK